MVLFSAFYSTSQPAEAELAVLLITISAAIYLMILIIEIEDMRKLLLDRGNAARVLAVDDICDFFRHLDIFFLYDFSILDDVDRDTVIDVAEHINIYQIKAAVDLDDVLASHLAAARIFDNSHLAVQLVQPQFKVNIHTASCLDVVQNKTFF